MAEFGERRRSAGIFLLLALLAAPAFCAAGAADDFLGDKSLSLFAYAGQGFHLEHQGFTEVGSVAIQASRRVFGHAEALLEFQPLFFIRQPAGAPRGPRETVHAVAFDVGFRYFPAPPDLWVQPYIEVLDGPFYGDRHIPERGSAYNFLTQAGVGIVLFTGKSWHPFVSWRWVHISNASLYPHNPDWDHWAIAIGGRLSFGGSR